LAYACFAIIGYNYPTISVVICTLNEEHNLCNVLPKIPKWIHEVIIVDGHSTDNTVQVAKNILPEIRLVNQPDTGKDNAMKYGFKKSTGEIIVTLDADGSTDPTQIPDFVALLLEGYDFVKGSRFLKVNPVMPIHRNIGNKILADFTNLLFGTRYTDVCCGYNAFWRKCLEKIDLSSNGFDYEPVLYAKITKAGLKVAELQCTDRGRIHGDSKLPMPTQGLKAVLAIVKQRLLT
jgi:glycosyltransferase involved in cell wall biosynthesis